MIGESLDFRIWSAHSALVDLCELLKDEKKVPTIRHAQLRDLQAIVATATRAHRLGLNTDLPAEEFEAPRSAAE